MAWKKESDTAAHHPMVTAPMTFVEWPERMTGHDFANLVWGVISRAATQSAQFKTDYVVKAGVLANTAGDNWRHWVAIATRAGYLTPVDLEDGGVEEAWLLVEDSEDLFHIRRKAELEWEARRKKDNGNPWLIVPVRLRDGDGCRYCGVVVNWKARRGGRAGTYDHRVPGQGAESPDDLRVSCGACNGRRGDREDADLILPPLSAPASPYYGEETADLLAEHGHQVPLSTARRPRIQRDAPRKSSDLASSEPTLPDVTSGQRLGSQPVHAPPSLLQEAARAGSNQRPDGQSDPARDLQKTCRSPATPPPEGPREQVTRPDDQSEHAFEQRKPRPTDPAGRRHTPVRTPGRDGDGTGRASEREAQPVLPLNGRRSRARRGRPPQPPHLKGSHG